MEFIDSSGSGYPGDGASSFGTSVIFCLAQVHGFGNAYDIDSESSHTRAVAMQCLFASSILFFMRGFLA
jgi:hypothetical protein